MTINQDGTITFGNLIEADNLDPATIGAPLILVTPVGGVNQAVIQAVSERAKSFGARFKAGMGCSS